MIPFIPSPSLTLGPIHVELFGVLVSAGIYVGARMAVARAVRLGLQAKIVADFVLWSVISGVVFGHLVHLLAYHPEELARPFQIFKVWDGLSSFGGVLGGVVAGLILFRVRKQSALAYGDALAPAIAAAWAISRVGCFTAHDHLGVRSSFPLAVAFPGGARHDLGLYDALLLGGITAVLLVLSRRKRLERKLLAVLAVLYAPGRFLLDFLRASDVPYHDARYLGLTPAQYFCFALAGWGLFVLLRPAAASSARQAQPPPTGEMASRAS